MIYLKQIFLLKHAFTGNTKFDTRLGVVRLALLRFALLRSALLKPPFDWTCHLCNSTPKVQLNIEPRSSFLIWCATPANAILGPFGLGCPGTIWLGVCMSKSECCFFFLPSFLPSWPIQTDTHTHIHSHCSPAAWNRVSEWVSSEWGRLPTPEGQNYYLTVQRELKGTLALKSLCVHIFHWLFQSNC